MKLINLEKSYNNQVIFKNINYTFEKGQVYWLQGKNAVGKSTFLRSLIGLEKFNDGDIINTPKNILYIPEVELTEKWLTIKENINFIYNIASLKLDNNIKLDKLLNINETDFNTISMNCSTGTNMKVGFSLLYAKKDWDLIVIDEAFSHIDANTQTMILKKLIDLSIETKCIVIFIHHNNILKSLENKINIINLKKDGLYNANSN